MSYRIEYQYCAFVHRMPGGGQDDRFVIAVEGGDNNLYESSNGKRVRSWDVCMLGTATQVLKQAVEFGGSCEGGCLKPHGRDCTPEAYIRRIRRLIEAPREPGHGCWYPYVLVPKGHALAAAAARMGLAVSDEKTYGLEREFVHVGPDQRHLVFEFVDRFPDLNAWSLAKVSGLPKS